MANNLSNNPQTVPVGGIIQLPDTPHLSGTAISNSNGTITLAANQQYYVDYRTNATSPSGIGVAAALYLDGTYIPMTNSLAEGGSLATLSGSAIISTTQSSRLTLRNPTGVTASYGSTAVNVIKLA
ncbi:hypothetical protein ACE3NQ_29180 [Paenibacillus terreus]|uniref:BclA C-terminal domain-containing protein n=1 Tax=Paenibacillus terreus TaxID=1387834 RepID=A0ABV5BH10_9BACL